MLPRTRAVLRRLGRPARHDIIVPTSLNLPLAQPMPETPGFFDRLRVAGIEADDDHDRRFNKTMLVLATGLVCSVMMLWVLIYQWLGQHVSATLPLLIQVVLVANLLVYIASRGFERFRLTQVALFLFLPFVAHWIAGNFITSSGVVLWGVLAPVAAILCFGTREAIGWFIGWLLILAASTAADYFLADPMLLPRSTVPIRISLIFFALNFAAVAGIAFTLLLVAIEQKQRMRQELDAARQRLEVAQSAADSILFRPFL